MSFGIPAFAAFIVFIGVLIFVHELGHFLAAKYFNIKVLKFSLGFGPPLVAFTRGETTYQVAVIPLGGFVKMLGDSPLDESGKKNDRGLSSAPIYQRAIIYSAGPAFNLLLPILCFFAYSSLGPMVHSPVMGQIEMGQPADLAGLKAGDRILSVDGERTWSFDRFQHLISERPGKPTRVSVLRDGRELELTVTPAAVTIDGMFGTPVVVGRVVAMSARAGTAVGIDDPAKHGWAFATGDRILQIDDQKVTTLNDVDRVLAERAGRDVVIRVARSAPLAAGDVLFADATRIERLEISVPSAFRTLADLGLAHSGTFVRMLVPGGAAERAGLRSGDRIVEVNGKPIRLFWSVIQALHTAGEGQVAVKVRRDGQLIDLVLTSDRLGCVDELSKKETTVLDPGFGRGALDQSSLCWQYLERNATLSHWSSVAPPQTEKAELGLAEALVWSLAATHHVVSQTATAIYKLMAREISHDNVGGILQLYRLASEAADLGFGVYLERLAFVSVNIGLINLLPIPIFDGGHLLFLLVEGIRRQPLSLRTRELASLVGLVLLFALIILAFHNDLRSFGVF